MSVKEKARVRCAISALVTGNTDKHSYQECCHLFPVLTLHFTTRYHHHTDLEMFKLHYLIKVNGLNSVTHPGKRSNDYS